MFNKHDLAKNENMLTGCFREQGYDWWWHSFTGRDAETGEEKPFFIEYFICNPALAEDEPVLGQLPANKEAGKKPSYLMVKAGCWGENHKQVHRFFAWKDVKIRGRKPFYLEAKDCYCSDFHICGSVSVSEEEAAAHPEYMCEAGNLQWDLSVDKKVAFNVGYGTSKLFRGLKAFEMYWHAEGMKTLYTGTITVDGRKYIVSKENCYGYADKNWGRNFTTPWLWLSSNHMVSNITGKKLNNSVFDIGGGRPKVFFVPLKGKLLSAFWYEGKEYEFNFSKFWTCTKTKFKFEDKGSYVEWHVVQENRTALMKTMVRCKKKDMLLINYESPDGKKRHNNLWNGGNGVGRVRLYDKIDGKAVLVDDIRVYNIGCEYGEYDPE